MSDREICSRLDVLDLGPPIAFRDAVSIVVPSARRSTRALFERKTGKLFRIGERAKVRLPMESSSAASSILAERGASSSRPEASA